MSEPPASVRDLFVQVMRRVESIEKTRVNKDQHYKFRGIDDVLEAVGPLLRDVGLIVLPEKTEIVAEERYQSKSGSAMRSVTVAVTWRITGPAGDEMVAQTLGESADSSDKAIAKAQSVAGRVLWLEGLWVPTGQPDPDEQTYERAPLQQRRQQRQRDEEPPPPPAAGREQRPGAALRRALGADISRLGTVVLRRTQADLYAQFASAYGTTVVEASVEQLERFRDQLREEATEAQLAATEPPADEPAAGAAQPEGAGQ